MDIEIIEDAKTVSQLSAGCCSADVWSIFSPELES